MGCIVRAVAPAPVRRHCSACATLAGQMYICGGYQVDKPWKTMEKPWEKPRTSSRNDGFTGGYYWVKGTG